MQVHAEILLSRTAWVNRMNHERLKTTDALITEQTVSTTALGLLGAVSFSMTFSTLSWSEENDAARLIHAPVHRIPKTPEAFNTWLGGDARRIREAARENLTFDGASYEIKYPMDGFDGTPLWIEERAERVSGDGAKAKLVLGVLRDITQSKQSEMQAVWLAHHDPVTKLWNRSRFIEALDYDLTSSSLRRQPGFAAALSLSGLENIHINIGVDAADFLMAQAAKHISAQLKLPQKAARINKTAFGLFLPGLSNEDAKAVVREIGAWIRNEAHASPYGDLYTGCDVSGLALSQGSDASGQLALLETQLKPLGKGLHFQENISQPRPRTQNSDSFQIDDIKEAVHDRRLALAYQPIIDAQTRRVNHFECLLRLVDEHGEARSAAKMILAAEELGCVHLLDQRALEIGIETLRRYPDIHLAVNVSAATVQTELAMERYLAGLRALGADAERVTIELTETAALGESIAASQFAADARALGCRFAIDDFGTGHTSFQNLMTIEADIIKIDGSMVKDLSGAPHKQTFIRMIVDLARTFGVETVAEMVNSEADAALMARMGVTYFQGYMFGMPAAIPEFGEMKRAL